MYTTTITPPTVSGERTHDGTVVGVDSGTMAIATGGYFYAAEGLMFLTVRDTVASRPQAAVSSTGFGDGGYDVLRVVDNAGWVTGVEIVFILVDEARLKAEEPEWFTEDFNACYDAAYRRLLTTAEPRHQGDPRAFAELHVGAERPELEIGDPCYGEPSATIEVTPGRYVAVAYEGDMGDWGTRVVRLGAYLAEES